MIKNYFKIAFRVFKKDKLYTSINITGLAIGFAICILALGYLEFEFNYETHIDNADTVYRVTTEEFKYKKSTRMSARSPSRLAKVVPDAIPGITAVAEIITEDCLMRTNDAKAAKQKVYWVGDDFFKVFKGTLVEGNPNTVLDAPLKMVITASKAKMLFGDENPVGKAVKVNEGMPFQITGVVKDPPANSHLKYEYILPLSTWEKYGWINKSGSWWSLNRYTYVAIDESAPITTLKSTLNTYALTQVNPEKNKGKKYVFDLQSIKDIHLSSNFPDEISMNGNKNQVYIVLGISIAILFIVFVNFVNLSIATGLKRFKETGVRKVLGAKKEQLRIQFFIETFLLNAMALLLGIAMVLVSYNALASIFDINFSFAMLKKLSFWGYSTIVFTVSLMAVGFYPAVVLSSTKAISAIKGKMVGKNLSSNLVKNGLLVFQFTAAIFLVLGTVIVYKQIQFMKNADLGIETKQVLTLASPTTYNGGNAEYDKIEIKLDQFRVFKNELLSNPNIKDVGSCMHIPGEINKRVASNVKVVGFGEEMDSKLNIEIVDEGFFPVYEGRFLEGENFKENTTQRKSELIINEKARKELGYKTNEAAVNKTLKFWNRTWDIVGVVKDFHTASLSTPIAPTLYENRHPSEFGYYTIKFDSKNTQQTLSFIESTWKKLYPEDPFVPNFSDAFFNHQYIKNERFSKVFNALTILAILIINIGLIAMISFIVSDKLKELSIRRVLGANSKTIYFILSKGILKVTAVAILIGLPLSYYFLNNWLNNFAYSINLSVSDFIFSPLLIVVIALVNITYFVIKVLKYNPATIIRED